MSKATLCCIKTAIAAVLLFTNVYESLGNCFSADCPHSNLADCTRGHYICQNSEFCEITSFSHSGTNRVTLECRPLAEIQDCQAVAGLSQCPGTQHQQAEVCHWCCHDAHCVQQLASGVTTHDTFSSRAPTTTRQHALSRPGSSCLVCGNLDASVPCSDLDLVLAMTTKCPDTTPYCMNDVIQNGHHVMEFRRCVDEPTCDSLWYQTTSDEPLCLRFDPSANSGTLTCHLCCYGDDCNVDTNPPDNLLYRP